MAIATLPPAVDLAPETKKAVIDGVKQALAALQGAGQLDGAITYQALISAPAALAAFIESFRTHRETTDRIVRPQSGEGPVRVDDQMLVCGVSLAQIEHLLVRTCAKKALIHDHPPETVMETVTKTSFLFFKKTEQVAVQRAADPVEDRKIRELLRFMAFGWQLPLLAAYDGLTYQQVAELEEGLLALTTSQAIAAIADLDPLVIRKARQTTGAEFADVLASRPEALPGIAAWSHDLYGFYRTLLGDHAWRFFARDSDFFNIVTALDKNTARVVGDVLCYIAGENLQELERLNIDKTEVLVGALKGAFGKALPQVLSRPAFAKDFLRKTVDNLLHLNQEKDKLKVSVGLTCKALVPTVTEWLAKQPATPR
jgi:hypothetical protein